MLLYGVRLDEILLEVFPFEFTGAKASPDIAWEKDRMEGLGFRRRYFNFQWDILRNTCMQTARDIPVSHLVLPPSPHPIPGPRTLRQLRRHDTAHGSNLHARWQYPSGVARTYEPRVGNARCRSQAQNNPPLIPTRLSVLAHSWLTPRPRSPCVKQSPTRVDPVASTAAAEMFAVHVGAVSVPLARRSPSPRSRPTPCPWQPSGPGFVGVYIPRACCPSRLWLYCNGTGALTDCRIGFLDFRGLVNDLFYSDRNSHHYRCSTSRLGPRGKLDVVLPKEDASELQGGGTKEVWKGRVQCLAFRNVDLGFWGAGHNEKGDAAKPNRAIEEIQFCFLWGNRFIILLAELTGSSLSNNIKSFVLHPLRLISPGNSPPDLEYVESSTIQVPTLSISRFDWFRGLNGHSIHLWPHNGNVSGSKFAKMTENRQYRTIQELFLHVFHRGT
ncbi:hypothetical protein C8R44DRAFT_753727 [Mycena epipterygia]|nr:hypothetical protein C8R44DRAFT_753727 [Mycena epipterygia]